MRAGVRAAMKTQVLLSSDEEVSVTGQDLVRNAQRGFNHLSDMVISRLNVLERLVDIVRVLGIETDAYPQFRRDYEFCQLMKGAVGEGFLDKFLAAHERALAVFEKRCAQTDGEKELLACLRFTGLLEKLAVLEVTPDEYDELVEGVDDFRLSRIVEILVRAGVALDSQVEAKASAFDVESDGFLRFYEVARARARRMADRTVDEALGHGGKAVLLCLGFHLTTVKATWAGRQVSYLIALPPVTG
jgi:hypothetical protein